MTGDDYPDLEVAHGFIIEICPHGTVYLYMLDRHQQKIVVAAMSSNEAAFLGEKAIEAAIKAKFAEPVDHDCAGHA